MRAIKIDATARTVTDFEIEPGRSYPALKAALNDAMLAVAGQRHFPGPTPDSLKADFLFVDDEGLLKAEMQDYFVLPLFYPTPLAGNGVIVGTDDEGETVGCHGTTADQVRADIRWLKKSDVDDSTWRSMAAVTVSKVDADGNHHVIAEIPIDRDDPDPNHGEKVAEAMAKSVGI